MHCVQSVTFIKILIRMNVWIYSYQQNYTNKYPNIFILICLTRTNVQISICIENCTNIWIYSIIRQGFTLKHTHQRISEYIRTNKFDTNECPKIFVKEKLIRTNVRIYICDQYIRIYSSHSVPLLNTVKVETWPSKNTFRCNPISGLVVVSS